MYTGEMGDRMSAYKVGECHERGVGHVGIGVREGFFEFGEYFVVDFGVLDDFVERLGHG